MSTLVLFVGIAVTFLTVWGVIMVGSFLLGGEPAEANNSSDADWVSEPSPPAPVTPVTHGTSA